MLAPELQAANSILNRGLRYKLPAPVLLKFFGKKHINLNIRQLCLGTELRIAAILADKGLTDEKIEGCDPAKLMIEHYNDILRIVALASLNRKIIIRPAIWLRVWLLKRLTVWQLFELYSSIRQYSGLGPFMNITRLAVQTRTTKPNLGQVTGS